MVRQFGPDKMMASSSTEKTTTQAGDSAPSTTAVDGDDVKSVVRNLKLIFVSHIHGDHHMGLAKILARRRAVSSFVFADVARIFAVPLITPSFLSCSFQLTPPPCDPVYVVAPVSAMIYLQEFDDLEDIGVKDPSAVRLINTRRYCMNDSERDHVGYVRPFPSPLDWHALTAPETLLTFSRFATPSVEEASLESTLGLESIATVRVLHRVQCFGIVLRHTDGWSIV